MRPDDRLVVNELHPEDLNELKRLFAHDRQVKVMDARWVDGTEGAAAAAGAARRDADRSRVRADGGARSSRRRLEGSSAPFRHRHVSALVSDQGGRAGRRLPQQDRRARLAEGDGHRIDDPRPGG